MNPQSRPADSPSISIFALTGLFALAYALVTLIIAVIPTDLILAHYLVGSSRTLWVRSLVRVAAQAVIAWVSCLAALFLGRRTGGRLSGRGYLVIGSLVSGALAAVLEVTVHRLMLETMRHTYRASPVAGEALASLVTVGIVVLVTLLLIVRSTWVTPEAALPSPDR